MSNTKGSMLISNANAVGAELVNKLGGTGYKPVEWADAINLLGISNDDKASALASITEGTYTGDERGSIKYSNCNAVGSMLNKKFSTDRGFKPVEWESAISKLTPLAEGTVSGSVVSIENGADDVPTKSLIVTIPPTLSGVSSVTETQTGRNLADGTNFTRGLPSTTIGASIETITASTRYAYIGIDAKGTNYTISSVSTDTDYFNTILIYGYTNGVLSVYTNTAVNASKTVDFSACDYIRLAIGTRSASYQVPTDLTEYGTIQLEIGSTAHAYEPYTAPTTYTASLGRTIYGGTADVVKGEGTENYDKGSMSSTYLSGLNSDYIGYEASTAYFGGHPSVWVRNWNYQKAKARQSGGIGAICNYFPISMHNTTIFSAQYRIYFDVNGKGISDVAGFIAFVQNLEANNESLDIVYELETKTDFTFTGQEINTRLGYNAFWSDEGDTEVTYRKEPDIPDPPVQLLNMNNENNENNDN